MAIRAPDGANNDYSNADNENIKDNALMEAGWPPITMIAAIVFSSCRALSLIFSLSALLS